MLPKQTDGQHDVIAQMHQALMYVALVVAGVVVVAVVAIVVVDNKLYYNIYLTHC